MVEHVSLNGEIFIRQALLHPRRPFVAFKRPNGYLSSMKTYFTPSSLHVIDERQLVKLVSSSSNTTARNQLEDGNFCSAADPKLKGTSAFQECECPGQVRWHAGYKLQRLRGVQMAMVYLNFLNLAVDQYLVLLKEESPSDIQQRKWKIGDAAELSSPYSKDCRGIYCDQSYSCAMSWDPKMGPGLMDILDNADTKWKLEHPSSRAKSSTETGLSKCDYKDSKMMVTGGVSDGWVFFHIPFNQK
eukprot:FR735637.1.p1 GENE.FR735637.1~~FR735637.1.p1  ORF type:complete len:270 (+),score=31.99 FR735637.1:79-810(+)